MDLFLKKKFLKKKLLFNSDEVFMTNASNFVMPIVKIDGKKIAQGKSGPISLLLRNEYIKAI